MSEIQCKLSEEECLVLSDFYVDVYEKWKEVKLECENAMITNPVQPLLSVLKKNLTMAKSNMTSANNRRKYFLAQSRKSLN